MSTTTVSTANRIGHRSQARWIASLLAFGCGVVGLAISLHYPVAQPLVAGLFSIFVALFYVWSNSWLLLVPALLPLIGFAPWTGWISFEELDMLILAAAAAGYARLASRKPPAMSVPNLPEPKTPLPRSSMSFPVLALIVLFLASVVVAMLRGFTDAGGFSFAWFQGYHEPLNSLRVGKSFVLALLLVPLWLMIHKKTPELAQSMLSRGMMLGLAGASLATIWERVAFTGLLNFSSDYRTTGLFWEMHVGGAALDGFLALTMPFALREFLIARTSARWCVAATVLALAAYACLTTFSRGVYLAIPVGAAMFLGLHIWQKNQIDPTSAADTEEAGANRPLAAMLFVTAGFALSAAWIFQTSGYRGMAALLATVALMLPLARVMRRFTPSQWLLGVASGGLLTLLAGTMAALVPKGAYVAWGLAVVLTAAMLILLRQDTRQFSFAGPMAFAGFLATVAGTGLVANHWGDTAALRHATPILLVLLGVCVASGALRTPLWPEKLRWQATAAGAMAAVAAAVGVFGGGTYMSERFSTGGQDLGGRVGHWQLGYDMLRTPSDWVLGKGLGRFPANYFLAGRPQEHPGDYRLKQEGENTFLTLTSGLHVNGWGELFRVTQRIAQPGKPTIVTARVRAEKDVNLHFEVCEKHLLYNQGCVIKHTRVKGLPGVWQNIRLELQGEGASRGHWYAPRLLAFSMAVGSRGGTANLDDVTLTGADGHPLLANGDFSEGMAHWFFSSDRHHMPWHIKNMPMNVLFDQGVLGATLWGMMLVGALWHTSLGAARRHPLAPALAASLAGFAVVGLFDSLLDVPRLGWLFYLLLLLALTLRRQTRSPTQRHRARSVAGLALAVAVAWIGLVPSPGWANEANPGPQVIRVGPEKAIKTIAKAATLAGAGAIIEIDSGDYAGDVAVWMQDRLTLRAVGGRVKLIAAGASAEGKAIWVIRGGQVSIEGFDFVGVRVPNRNGAGIRFEKGFLRVRDCTFTDNENGILTSNQADATLTIENSEFSHNGHGDGQSHNLYVGAIARLSVSDSYFHHARVGHLLKSRAAVNHIFHNRLTDEADGTASYELEFPNGGLAYVEGNVIAQGISTENPHLISFGAEGYRWPRNEIHLLDNTLVNPLPRDGVFLRVAPGATAIRAANNRLVGAGKLESAGPGEYHNNRALDPINFERGLGGAAHNPQAMPRLTPPPLSH